MTSPTAHPPGGPLAAGAYLRPRRLFLQITDDILPVSDKAARIEPPSDASRQTSDRLPRLNALVGLLVVVGHRFSSVFVPQKRLRSASQFDLSQDQIGIGEQVNASPGE